MAFLPFLPAAIFGAVAVIVAAVSALADLAVRRAARRAMRPRRGFRLMVIEGGKRALQSSGARTTNRQDKFFLFNLAGSLP